MIQAWSRAGRALITRWGPCNMTYVRSNLYFNRNVPIKFFSKHLIPILNKAYHINTFQFATYTFAPTLNESAFYQLPTDPINSYLYYFEDTNDICIAFCSKQVGPRARATCRLVLLEDWRRLHHRTYPEVPRATVEPNPKDFLVLFG